MWTELLSIFRSNDPLHSISQDFKEMLNINVEMASIVEPHIFSQTLSLEGQSKVYKLDVKVNKLERQIRKQIVAHASLSRSNIAYCLMMMSIVKDAERVGDYVKNISEVKDLGGAEVPEGPVRSELQELVSNAMLLLKEAAQVVEEEDVERAQELVEIGRLSGTRCDRLLVELAKTNYNAAETTAMVLLTRFYKRLGGHAMNIISSVIMPVHKVDFHDEKSLAKALAANHQSPQA
jgi:phosphate transport system protein